MEFKSLTNIESSFRRIRLMLAVFVGCCTLVTVFALWNSYRFAEKQREKIYVLDGGKSLMLALSQDLRLDIAVDLGALVSMFNTINRIFYLSPEQMAQLNTEDRIALFKAMSHVGSMFAGKYVSSAMVLGFVKQVGARWASGRVARWVPVIGQGTAAALSYGMFTWLGESHIKECLAIRREAKLLMLTHTKEEA